MITKLLARLQVQVHVLLPCEPTLEHLEHLRHTADSWPVLVDAAEIGADIEMATDSIAPIEASVKRVAV